MKGGGCNQNHPEKIVETILTVLLVGFIFLILISFPIVGGGVAYFYFFKRRLAKKRNDTLRYDFISEPQQISLTETLNYFPSRSFSINLDSTSRPCSNGIAESKSTSTLLCSKSIGSELSTEGYRANGLTLPSTSNLQQKLFANKVGNISQIILKIFNIS